MDDCRRVKLAKEITNLIRENDVSKLKKSLNKFSLKERCAIVSTIVDDSAMLFKSVHMGNVEQVGYLLEDCHADIEQRGKYDQVKCTPLWIAILHNHLHVVMNLVEFGADVNTQSDRGRSAISIGYRNVKIVTFLLRRGADLNVVDEINRSCLMYSVNHLKMCRLLLSYGANVNLRDTQGKSALLLAVNRGRLKIVKLFVRNGADLQQTDENGNNALILAAIRYRVNITEYLINTGHYSYQTVGHAYELLGSQFAIVNYNSQYAINFWLKALDIRSWFLDAVPPNPTHTSHANVKCIIGSEFETSQDLESIAFNLMAIWTQALLIQSRILGSTHPTTINSFFLKAYDFIYQSDIGLGMDLLACIFIFFKDYSDPFKETISSVIGTFRSLLKIRNSRTNDVQVRHVLDMFSFLVRHMTGFLSGMSPRDRRHRSADVERYLVEIIHLTDLIMSFDLTKAQLQEFKKLLYALIAQRPRGMNQASLLHLSIRMYPSLPILGLMIECGECVNATDDMGNTPVHYVIEYHVSYRDDLLKNLIEHGCHIDMVNKKGYSTLEYLKHLLPYPLRHTTLQCLAARVLRQQGIPYQGLVPRNMEQFILCHGSPLKP